MSNPSVVPMFQAGQNAIPNKYLIRLNDEADITDHLSWLQREHPDSVDDELGCQVVHKYTLIKGYAAILGRSTLEDFTRRNDVESITEDHKPTY
ncbi:peptidase inhibitor i9 [Rhizoctonia solani]|uniref:Peptidase inhibitor i9 n=1 Tax=Rhizoctonia solani TaxID=456999 RepID=A0A8H8P2W1_9AGAM|nr:peptidase inhibitor i9 [Rhizoctonia solani]QRW22941.1 peptidase inhibitor i9 [Rhizoctonia solani]